MSKNLDARILKIPSFIWTRVAQIDELKGKWSIHTGLPKTVGNRLKQSVLVTSTGASTRIEGSALSDQDVENLMRGLAMAQFADRDKQEVRGYFELLENVFNSFETIHLTESMIKHFHQELLRYVEKDSHHRGNYKIVDNKVQLVDSQGAPQGIIFDTTPAYLTPIEMQILLSWISTSRSDKTIHPLIGIGAFIVEFLHIHPFQDGNGRLSRILTNFLLLQQGYTFMPYMSHEKIIEDNKRDYYIALRRSQQTFRTAQEDILPWIDFFTNAILVQAQASVQLLKEDFIELQLSPIQLQVWSYLQERREASPGEISEACGIVRVTVSQALDKLMSMGKIEVLGEGRATRYRLK